MQQKWLACTPKENVCSVAAQSNVARATEAGVVKGTVVSTPFWSINGLLLGARLPSLATSSLVCSAPSGGLIHLTLFASPHLCIKDTASPPSPNNNTVALLLPLPFLSSSFSNYTTSFYIRTI